MRVPTRTRAFKTIENVFILMEHPSFCVKGGKSLIPLDVIDGLTTEESGIMKTRITNLLKHVKTISYKNASTAKAVSQQLKEMLTKLGGKDPSEPKVVRKIVKKAEVLPKPYKVHRGRMWPMKIDTCHNAQWNWKASSWSTEPLSTPEIHKGFKLSRNISPPAWADKGIKLSQGGVVLVKEKDMPYFEEWLKNPGQIQYGVLKLYPGCTLKTEKPFGSKWDLKKLFWTEKHFFESLVLNKTEKNTLQTNILKGRSDHVSKGQAKFFAIPGYPRFFVRIYQIDWHRYLHQRSKHNRRRDDSIFPQPDQYMLPL